MAAPKGSTLRQEAEAERERWARSRAEAAMGAKQLKEVLCTSVAAVGCLFSIWDINGDGQISQPEFQKAVEVLGVDVTPQACEAVFREFDPDGSGTVSYAEFLRFALRDKLARNATKVMDFFQNLDADGSGEISLDEFRKAVASLGFDIPYEHTGEIFADMDADKSGSLSYRELHKQLRQGASVKLHKRLRAGGAGKIRMTTNERFRSTDLDPAYDRPTAAPELRHTDSRGAAEGGAAEGAAAEDERAMTAAGASRADRATKASPRALKHSTRPTTAPAMPNHAYYASLIGQRTPMPPGMTIPPDAAGTAVGGGMGGERPRSLFTLQPLSSNGMFNLTISTTPRDAYAKPPTKYVTPGGGGGPRPSPRPASCGRAGFAARGLVVFDEKRRRTIQDEKVEIAMDRARGQDLIFERKMVSRTGPKWREPLPGIDPATGAPLVCISAMRYRTGAPTTRCNFF